jgi:hypothetical protein
VLGKTIDDPHDAVLHERVTEVEQVPEPLVCKAQVGQELLLVCVGESFNALHFDDDLVFDKQIDPKALVELEPFVRKRNSNLPFLGVPGVLARVISSSESLCGFHY